MFVYVCVSTRACVCVCVHTHIYCMQFSLNSFLYETVWVCFHSFFSNDFLGSSASWAVERTWTVDCDIPWTWLFAWKQRGGRTQWRRAEGCVGGVWEWEAGQDHFIRFVCSRLISVHKYSNFTTFLVICISLCFVLLAYFLNFSCYWDAHSEHGSYSWKVKEWGQYWFVYCDFNMDISVWSHSEVTRLHLSF